jgi:pyruvate,water dikinase
VFAGRLWREQLRDWDETFKPASIRKHRELQSVEPERLSDAELCVFLTRCREHHVEMIYQHMRFTGAAMIAIGDLLTQARGWTGVPAAELLGMTRGAAPVSSGASRELAEMVTAMRADRVALELLASDGDASAVLEELIARDGDTGPAVSAYLDLVGYRLLDGFDISGRYALELPDALLRAMRASVADAGDADGVQAEVEAKVAEVRAQVPEEHRDEFQKLLGEARLMYRIRDERGVFSDIWASGIVRRAALAAGRRLARTGRIKDPEHFLDARFEEMVALLSGPHGPSADELERRYAWRTSHTAKDAPPTLGPPPPPLPHPASLPAAAARVMRAMGITMRAMSADSDAPHEGHRLRGFASTASLPWSARATPPTGSGTGAASASTATAPR